MTDKQIIIDGVNVAGCECYNKDIKMDCLLWPLQPDRCSKNPNCYFKQLACKTQECETLEERAKIAEEKFKDCFNEIIEIKNELTEYCFNCMNNRDHEVCGDCIENKILNRLEVYEDEK